MKKLHASILIVGLAGSPVLLPGCSFLRNGAAAVTEKDSTTQVSALQKFLYALPKIFTNPTDPEVIGSALGVITTFLAGAFGLKKLKSLRNGG